MHPVSLNNSFQAELTNRLKHSPSVAFSRLECRLNFFWLAATRVSRWVPYFCFIWAAVFKLSCRGRGRSMWTTLFTVVLILAATLNVLAIVSNYTPPEF